MAWLSDYQDMGAARDRAQKALLTPIGMMSPLWAAFGVAASAGAAWWWMTRWTRAVNLEALAATPEVLAVEAPVIENVARPEAVEPEPTVEAVAAPEPIPAPEPLVEAAPETPAEPDDLTRLVGIGPKLAEALAARGVTRFTHLAAWTADDLAIFDAALSLKGRAVRDAWVAQAKRLAEA